VLYWTNWNYAPLVMRKPVNSIDDIKGKKSWPQHCNRRHRASRAATRPEQTATIKLNL
jgi:hypothetical protein